MLKASEHGMQTRTQALRLTNGDAHNNTCDDNVAQALNRPCLLCQCHAHTHTDTITETRGARWSHAAAQSI